MREVEYIAHNGFDVLLLVVGRDDDQTAVVVIFGCILHTIFQFSLAKILFFRLQSKKLAYFCAFYKISLYFCTMKLRIFIVVCLLCCTSLLEAVTLNEARNLINNKDYPAAVAAFRQLMEQPAMARNAEVNKFYGQALCMTGAYAESVPFLEAGAKGNKTGAWWYLGISYQHLYNFDGAIEALEKYKTAVGPTSAWIPRTDSIIAECQVGQKALRRTHDVVIIDSMVVKRAAFWSRYMLGAESGRLLTNGTYENQASDYHLWADVDSEGVYHLYEQHRFGETWEEPQVIASIDAEGATLCYPFMRSDGETLYFGSNITPGMGGFDIYKTHYNADSESYYTPERLGMPFNSPFDDYMLAIDETHQVGWWATNRSSAPDEVCIYLFLATDDHVYLEEPNVARARVDRIADSWRNKAGYQQLVEEILTAPQAEVVEETITIAIADNRVYHSTAEFRNPKALEAYQQSIKLEEELTDLQNTLEQQRAEWHNANANQRQQLRTTILNLEKREEQLSKQLKAAQKRYRNLEIETLN